MSMRRSGVVPLVRLRSCDDSSDDESTISQASSSRGATCATEDHGGVSREAVRIKHLTRTSLTGRFPKLDECAHFHYENVELAPVKVGLCEESPKPGSRPSAEKENEGAAHWFCLDVTSHGQHWQVRRSYDNFRMLDRQLHRCVFDRKYSQLPELPPADPDSPPARETLEEYLDRFSALSGGGMITCGPVLNWLELDNRGHRLLVTDEAALNTPAVAAAYVVRPHVAQAADEISFCIGDMISVTDMPPTEESTWWRGKKGFQVGFFPSECVEVIGEKVPHTLKVSRSTKPVLRRHGKLIAFFRSFLLSRPSRRKLKQTGILKERVFGCDLGEHLQNTGRDIPLVLEACTEFLDQFGIVDGIYRLSGVNSNIQKLRVAFDEDTMPDLRGDEAIMQDIHSVASLLKMYFRELPNPLLTYQLYEELVASVSGPEEGRLARLRGVVRRLPPPHYRTLRHLLLHLARVAAHGNTTGMTPRNVAIVWAPNLLRSRSVEAGGGVAALHVIGIQAVLTEYLIRYADILFSHRAPALSPAPPDSGANRSSRGRPKSLAVCTTRLLTLEEARSRAPAPQNYIDVGGGPPPRYHTILELPKSAKKSGWRAFFSRNSSTSRKHSNLLPTSPSTALQDQTILSTTKGLRPVKSAESLVLLSGSSCRNSREEEEEEESFEGSRQSSVKSSQSRESSSTIQKHGRSTSHDSYFDHPITFELSSPDSPRESKKQKLDDHRTVVERYGNEDTIIVEVHATHEPEKSCMEEEDDQMFEEPIFIQRLSPISLPQLEQLCSGCEVMDSQEPPPLPSEPQECSGAQDSPLPDSPEEENYCAKSQSLLSSSNCSLKTTSFFFDPQGLLVNATLAEVDAEPHPESCKYPSPNDALSLSSSSTEEACTLLPSSSDLHIHEEEENNGSGTEEVMLVDTKTSPPPLNDHSVPSQSSSNPEISAPLCEGLEVTQSPTEQTLAEVAADPVSPHTPNLAGSSASSLSHSSESLHSSHSCTPSQQSEASKISSWPDLTSSTHSAEAPSSPNRPVTLQSPQSPLTPQSTPVSDTPSSVASSPEVPPTTTAPRLVDAGRCSNFRELFCKFEHSNSSNPPAPADKVKPQLSLFTQLKILKLQSLSSPVAQSPQYDPWNNPILDRLNQEEESIEQSMEEEDVVASPTSDPMQSDSAMKEPCSEASPQPVEENPPPAWDSGTAPRDSLGEVAPCTVDPQLAEVQESQPTEDPAQRTLRNPAEVTAPEEDRTRRERINRIKEARRAQLREKLKLEHLLEPEPSYRLRRSWTRPGEAEAEERPPTSRYLRASIR